MPTGETFDLDCQAVILAIGESVSKEDLPPFIIQKGKVVESDHLSRTKRPLPRCRPKESGSSNISGWNPNTRQWPPVSVRPWEG